jgi:hypothetical protein
MVFGRRTAGSVKQVMVVFRISRSKSPLKSDPLKTTAESLTDYEVSRFCATENWTGDLSNGLFQLGKIGSYYHGLEEGECGLLTLLRCYEPNDRVNILELLENASASPSSFCFSTYIIVGPSERQPLMCVGESIGFADTTQGSMHGVFVFPRMVGDKAGTH